MFDGEDDSPLPSMLGTMMNHSSGLSVLSVPINHSLSVCHPEYQVG